MRRFLRLLFDAATVLSLVLFVSTVVLWLVGDFDYFWMTGERTRRHVGMHHAALIWSAIPNWPYKDLNPRWFGASDFGGIHLLAIFLLSALLPLYWFRRRLWPRIKGALWPVAEDIRVPCRVCGYDLRATPDRCPECGAIPAGVKA